MDKDKLISSNKNLLDNDLKIMKEVIEKHEGVRERVIRYIYQLITALGLVAGFGFTAISFVKSIYLFTLGELLLFSAMAIGMRFVKRAFIDEAKLYGDYVDKLGKIIDDRTKIPSDDSVENISFYMNGIAQKELKVFEDKPAAINSDFILGLIFYLFIFGSILLLLSFTHLWGVLFFISSRFLSFA